MWYFEHGRVRAMYTKQVKKTKQPVDSLSPETEITDRDILIYLTGLSLPLNH